MNDPKDIIVSIENIKEEEEVNQHPVEDINENEAQTEESRMNNLVYHLYENFGKKFYKRTLKEIDLLIQNKYLKGYSKAWKIYILKIRGILKIIKKKIDKYLIQHIEKAKIKHHINSIKKYLNQIPIELNYFFDNFIDEKSIYEVDKIDYLIRCYFEYIYLYSFFNKKIDNTIDSITFLSFILRLYKETQFIVKYERTISHIEKCFILLSHMFIYNEDYFSAIEYLNIAMDVCLKHIIFDTKDPNDGIYLGDKNKLIYLINKKENFGLNKNKYENELENNFGDKKIKRVISNIIIIYLYRGICYENIGKMKNSIKCYYQCLWFINHFFYDSFKNLSHLINNILDKSLEFKGAVDFLVKKINYYDRIQSLIKNIKKKNDSDKEDKKQNNNIFNNFSSSKKFKGLVNKLSKLKINEIDTVNKFEVKKNIKDLSSRKREGKDKNIFLSDIRLLDAYLREDFKVMIDKMDKIKSFDMDFSTRDKIQKFLRRLYFEENQEKLKKRRLNELYITNKKFRNPLKSRTSIIKYDDLDNLKNNLKKTIIIKKKDLLSPRERNIYISELRLTHLPQEKYISIKSPKSCKNIRAISAFSEKRTFSFNKPKNKRIFSPISFKSDIKSQTVSSPKKEILNTKKSSFVQRYRKMKLFSAKAINKIETENKELNKFFNKKYIQKRDYIKKLEERELKFQKCILKLKDTPKSPMQLYNKEVMKQNANQSFQKIMTLFISNPVNWKENLSPQEVKNIMLYDKLESSLIKSLDRNALIKFKNEEKKQKGTKHYKNEELNLSLKDINENNINVIKDIDNRLEEIKQREIIENKNYEKLVIKNRKFLKYKNERSLQNLRRIKFKSANISPISNYEKFSFSNNIIINNSNQNKTRSHSKL